MLNSVLHPLMSLPYFTDRKEPIPLVAKFKLAKELRPCSWCQGVRLPGCVPVLFICFVVYHQAANQVLVLPLPDFGPCGSGTAAAMGHNHFPPPGDRGSTLGEEGDGSHCVSVNWR